MPKLECTAGPDGVKTLAALDALLEHVRQANGSASDVMDDEILRGYQQAMLEMERVLLTMKSLLVGSVE